MKKKIRFGFFVVAGIVLVTLFLISGSFYTYWTVASPERTCLSCHEINPSFNTWASSAHRDVSCFECHGTALSNGFHSLKEKSKMVFTHVKSNVSSENLHMSEKQLLETMDRCKNCHQTEYANWKASGHSAKYADIFLHETHNKTEQLNGDCLRCHGMFYDKTTSDLVEPISQQGPWNLKELEKAGQPTIPCMACHQIHSPGETAVQPDYAIPNNIFYSRNLTNHTVGFYSRHEKKHFQLDQLPRPDMVLFGDTVQTPADPVYRLCVQCHAPSAWHEVGTNDDHTPVGVHQGISCNGCHEPHSNNQRNSCDKCHSEVSKNCKLDVRTMNTTYSDPTSPNDIHFVSCKNCHEDKNLKNN